MSQGQRLLFGQEGRVARVQPDKKVLRRFSEIREITDLLKEEGFEEAITDPSGDLITPSLVFTIYQNSRSKRRSTRRGSYTDVGCAAAGDDSVDYETEEESIQEVPPYILFDATRGNLILGEVPGPWRDRNDCFTSFYMSGSRGAEGELPNYTKLKIFTYTLPIDDRETEVLKGDQSKRFNHLYEYTIDKVIGRMRRYRAQRPSPPAYPREVYNGMIEAIELFRDKLRDTYDSKEEKIEEVA